MGKQFVSQLIKLLKECFHADERGVAWYDDASADGASQFRCSRHRRYATTALNRLRSL